MPRSRKSHLRRTEADWREICRRFESSGRTQREFCRREGLALSSFQRWRRRLGSVPAPAEFVELVPSAAGAPPAPSWSLEVALPNGVCLRLRG